MAVKICPECGGKVAQTRTTCIHCGYDFESLFRYCQECGCRVSDDEVECPECGSYELGETMCSEEISYQKICDEEENKKEYMDVYQPFTFEDIISKETYIIPDESVFTMIEVVVVEEGLYILLRSKEIKYKNIKIKSCADDRVLDTFDKQCNSIEYIFVSNLFAIETSWSSTKNFVLDFGENIPYFIYCINNKTIKTCKTVKLR